MPFQKGHKKIGGRKILTKNKITQDVEALMDKLHCNPIEGMAVIAADPKVPVAVRGHMYAQLAKYVHPQMQSVQLTGRAGGPIEIKDVSPHQLLADRIARIIERSPKS